MSRSTAGLLFWVGMALAAQSQTSPPSKSAAGRSGQTASAAAKAPQKIDSLRNLVPRRWWETASSLCRVSLKSSPADAQGRPAALPSFQVADEAKASVFFDGLKAQGCDALSFGDPADTAGRVYPGLATKDHYRVAPEIGTIESFRRLVRLAHSKKLPTMISYNLGYCSLEAAHWLKACDDVRAGRNSKEAKWFLWSDRADAPPPIITKDTFFMVRPTHLPGAKPGTFYDPTKAEVWEYSERAGRYFWSKWSGNVDGKIVRLPQYNWMSLEFQAEAEKITRFWMDTGVDGMMQDAVNWYVGYTWEKGRQCITDVVKSYGNTYTQPEGAGGFYEDPVAWITEGGWNSVQDYSLGIWWERKSNKILNAIESGDPRPVERALRDYRDRVVAAGGVLYFEPLRMMEGLRPEHQRLAIAVAGCAGELLCFRPEQPLPADPEMHWLLETKRAHPALHNLGLRRQLPTQADDKYYAFLRTAANGAERVLVVLNFQATSQTVDVDLSGVAAAGLVDLKSGSEIPRQSLFRTEVPAYGYRLYQFRPSTKLP